MQLRGFNDDATRLIAFIFARDTYVMKKTMERENGGEWTAFAALRYVNGKGSYHNFFMSRALFYCDYFFENRKMLVVVVGRRRCRCRVSAEAKFPISEDTEDPRYKWELGIGQMRFITERFTSLNLFP